MHDIDWSLLGMYVAVAMASGVAIYHVVAGYYHVRYYRRQRHNPEVWKCQAGKFLTPKQHRNAVLMGTGNLALGGLITGILIYAIHMGMPTPIYFEVGDYGWAYTILSTIGLFIVLDASAYYVHRALHFKWFFRNVHRHHHKFIATSPYVVTALHPLELVMLQGVSFIPLFFIPFHAVGIGIVLVYILIWNIIDHSGVKLFSSLPWQGPTMYHDDHHKYFHVNFGQHLMIWDRMHGTLRREGRTYGKDVFGGYGKPNPESETRDEFVNY